MYQINVEERKYKVAGLGEVAYLYLGLFHYRLFKIFVRVLFFTANEYLSQILVSSLHNF